LIAWNSAFFSDVLGEREREGRFFGRRLEGRVERERERERERELNSQDFSLSSLIYCIVGFAFVSILCSNPAIFFFFFFFFFFFKKIKNYSWVFSIQ